MSYPRQYIPFLVAGMLITGCANSLWSKYQDMQCVANCDDPITRREFSQPVWQTAQMFVGESACLVAFSYLTRKKRKAHHKRSLSGGNLSTNGK